MRDSKQKREDVLFMKNQKTSLTFKMSPLEDKSFQERHKRKIERQSKPNIQNLNLDPIPLDSFLNESPEKHSPMNETDFIPPLQRRVSTRKKLSSDPEFLATLDRTGVSSGKGARVAAATAKYLGHDLNDLSISKSSIHNNRTKVRSVIGKFKIHYKFLTF